ncbi:RimK/LysX family protein [Patescibacteria group bacterium]|nr:RimK/LysX family protein [Patescibacteria group bacterium]MBU1673681.1 RimK/LysX family protein [Patescibacteria group bacterium]MBU1963491.1 RimK/LysX family protein [Patescibacteria group bacterium]
MLEILKNRQKVLGINARNLRFIRPANKKSASRIALDKLKSKNKLEEEGLPVAKLFGVIKNRKELLSFPWNNLPDSFVLKPNFGFGGEGVMIIFGKKKNGHWITTNNHELTIMDFMMHASNILDGNFSLNNISDIAIFEERLTVASLFKPLTHKGVPDIRVIVYNNVPVMAMVRLPTKSSGSKANIHQGGIGLGIDLATGITTHGVTGNKLISQHPESNIPLAGIKIPDWDEMLRIAIQATNVIKLGFCGVDIALDKKKGPVILEINSHPGLGIQIANLTGLRERLERVKGLDIKTVERGIKVAKQLFGGEIEAEIEEKSGRHIVGLHENVTLYGKEEKQAEVTAKIDTGADLTSVDINLAKKLGFEEAIALFEKENIPDNLSSEEALKLKKELQQKLTKAHPDIKDLTVIRSSHGRTLRIKIPIDIKLNNEVISTQATLTDRSHLKFPVIIGKKNLKKFLIDPTKKK